MRTVLLVALLMTAPAHAAALPDAAEAGDPAEVRRLVDSGVPVDQLDEDGESALIEAAEAAHAEVVRFLLERGARVNLRDREGETALMEAAEEGHTEVLRLLLARPTVDLGAADREGRTALMKAVEERHPEAVSLLLEAGAPVGPVDRLGRSALDLAGDDAGIRAMLEARGAR